MSNFRLLPWEYATRNLFRRPMRTVLTVVALTIVVMLVLVVVGFIRGLQRTLAVSGDPQVAIVFSLGMGANLEYSSVPMRTGDLVAASVRGVRERYGRKYVSPELFLGTEVTPAGATQPAMGLIRGVTQPALLVRRQVEIEQGAWPQAGEVMVGNMVAKKLGAASDQMLPGRTLSFEGRSWRISGVFSASGSALASEIWCRLDELQQATKRQDLSLVAVTLSPGANFAALDLFCKERLDLELQAVREPHYYASLARDYRPVLMMAWLLVALVAGAGVFSGLNTMYAAVVGRTAELSMLQTIGFSRRAIAISLVTEGVILAAAATLLATVFAIAAADGAAVRFTMGAFALCVDAVTVLIGSSVGFALGLIGSLPPAIRAFRLPIVEGLKIV